MSGVTMMLLSASNPIPTLSPRFASAQEVAVSPASAFASITFELLATGLARSTAVPGGVTSYAPDWLLGGVPSQWEVRFTVTSGSPSGTFNTWLALSSDRSFSLTASRSSVGTTSNGAVVLVEIRPAGGGTTVASASMTLNATATVET